MVYPNHHQYREPLKEHRFNYLFIISLSTLRFFSEPFEYVLNCSQMWLNPQTYSENLRFNLYYKSYSFKFELIHKWQLITYNLNSIAQLKTKAIQAQTLIIFLNGKHKMFANSSHH